jgi:hypothetical protein
MCYERISKIGGKDRKNTKSQAPNPKQIPNPKQKTNSKKINPKQFLV